MNKVLVDTRLVNKIEYMNDFSNGNSESCCIKFKDLDDSFWFESKESLQEFLNLQTVERFYDRELRKGYFDFINEHEETLRYHVEANRGKLTVTKEENLGKIN